MKFTKMHGAGNDYVYVNCFVERVDDPQQVAIKVSNRNFGVGSDGLILIMPSEVADVRMRMFNSDGSESEMCGNGIRCVAKYAYDHGIVTKKEITAETGAGILTLQLFTEREGYRGQGAGEYGETAAYPCRDPHAGHAGRPGGERAAQHPPYDLPNHLRLNGKSALRDLHR